MQPLHPRVLDLRDNLTAYDDPEPPAVSGGTFDRADERDKTYRIR